MIILICVLIFLFGVGVGYILKWELVRRFDDFSGIMYVHKDPRKTIYSLELDDDPEKLRFKKVVIFKVKASKESSIRE